MSQTYPRVLISTSIFRAVAVKEDSINIERFGYDSMGATAWSTLRVVEKAGFEKEVFALLTAFDSDLRDAEEELWKEKEQKSCPTCSAELQKVYEEA